MKGIAQMFRWRWGRPTGKSSAAGALTILPLVMLLALTSAPPALADHSEMYVVCPASIREGHTAFMQIRDPGARSVSVSVSTDHRAYTADGDDYIPYEGETITSDPDEDTVRVPVETREDYSPEYDENFSIGFEVDRTWHGCVVTILDDDTPEVTSVEITSTPAVGNAYIAGENITVAVTFDQEVEVDGSPVLGLYVGDSSDHTWRGARYRRGSGTRTLTFIYTVQAIDKDTNGVSVSSAGVDADRNPAYGFSGKIFAQGTDVQVDYTHPGIGDSSRHQVDGRPVVIDPRITSAPPGGWDAYRVNQVIEASMRFNIEVEVEGGVSLGLYVGFNGDNWDAARRHARYIRGSGTDTLVFGYTVRPGDMDRNGVMIGFGSPGNGFYGDGKIKAKGTDVERYPYFWGTGNLPDHKIDTAPPTISSINFNSQPRDSEAYDAGELVKVEVAFSEKVTISGDLQLELDIGGVTRRAQLQSPVTQERSYGDTMVFRYAVQEGDTDTDGIGISANSLRLNGGSIHDSAGNAAGLSHGTLPADSAHRVDTSREN